MTTSIADAVTDADLRVLLMCVFQHSGDRRWLEPPFAPCRDVNLIADEGAGLSSAAASEIRAAAVDLAGESDTVGHPAITDPGDELMVEMMSVCLGEQVPPEYAPMMREELGFRTRDIEWHAPRTASDPGHVLVVGAGPSGIVMGARLNRLGISYTIVEKANSIGGVWRDNRYPGCGVDTPNHAYSFSFTPPNRWSRFFAAQPEIEQYLQRSADDCGVTPHIRFGTTVTSATWLDARQVWRVHLDGTDGNETLEVPFLVSAIGQLNEPSIPTIRGIDTFEGPCFHSARWPEHLDVTGLRVAVIGTGASSMQLVPAIADQVGQLTVYQRSAQWARPVPRYHDTIPHGSQVLFERMPFYAAWFRFTMLWRYGDGLLPFLRKDPTWPHPERSLNRVNDRHRVEMTDHLTRELATRPDLIDRCLPTYPPYGKRILLDNGWYRTLTKPHVELVTDRIAAIDEAGVVTAEGTHRQADVVVFATGFHVTQMAARLDLTGRDGVNLHDAWADDNPTAHLGITVPGFPNLFCLQGPNTGLGHGGSAIFQSECQARYITGCIVDMTEANIAAIDVRSDVLDDYVERVDAEHERMIWTHPGMSTYYRNARGRVVSVMPWRLVDYFAMTRRPDFDEYHLTSRFPRVPDRRKKDTRLDD